jgi:hypothetical protein
MVGLGVALVVAGSLVAPATRAAPHEDDGQKKSTWTQILPNAEASDTRWSARAGLQAVTLGDTVYVMGGRVPKQSTIPGDSTLLNDVWSSSDQGKTWKRLRASGAPGTWAPRAYFAAVTKGAYMYVLGGQDFNVTENQCPPVEVAPLCPPFVSSSQFFNDVWRSRDGVTWTPMTAAAPWEGRAGLSAAVLDGALYVFAGSVNDDSTIIGGPPVREYFNDVWRSTDNGATWKEVTDGAPWSKRAGAATVVKGGHIYLLGGEVGFACFEPGCTPPYFNDVWRSRNGRTWTQVTPAAGWSPRPGHKCEVLTGKIICFGGFGLPTNPTDAQWSGSGRSWKTLAGSAWNAQSPDEIKYDFDSSVIPDKHGRPAIYTFGGDRETFSFGDPTNYLRVDNDVWRLTLGG